MPDLYDPQSLNPYSYCRNNPLVFQDPSGHFWVEAAFFVASVLYTGSQTDWDPNAMAMSAVTSLISAGAFYVAGNIIQSANLATATQAGYSSIAAAAEAGVEMMSPIAQAGIHAGAGALSGALNASITGGDIGKGAISSGLSAGIAKFSGGYISDDFGDQLVGRAVIGGVVGGLSSEIYGGSFGDGFANGAITSVAAFLFNEGLHEVGGYSHGNPEGGKGKYSKEHVHWNKGRNPRGKGGGAINKDGTLRHGKKRPPMRVIKSHCCPVNFF